MALDWLWQTKHCHRFLSHTTLSQAFHTHNFVTHTTLSHTTLSHTTLSQTTLHTQLCHIHLFHTQSFTHSFVTYNAFTHNTFTCTNLIKPTHTQHSHTQSHTALSPNLSCTISFPSCLSHLIFTSACDHWKKLICGVIRSFNSNPLWLRKVGLLKRRVQSHLAGGEIKNCTPLWREADLEVKMLKTFHSRSTFGSRDVEKLHAAENTSGSDPFWQ